MRNKKSNTPIVVHSHDVHLDSDYVQWIHDIKERFRGAQIKAAVKVNSDSYYSIGGWDGISFCENQRKNGEKVLLSS